jgi:hypothetical protein
MVVAPPEYRQDLGTVNHSCPGRQLQPLFSSYFSTPLGISQGYGYGSQHKLFKSFSVENGHIAVYIYHS